MATLILFLSNFLKGSCQDELDHYFKAVHDLKIAVRKVTKAALSKARKKLRYQAFIELNDHLIEYFSQNFSPLKWHGYNLMAVDGSTARLPVAQEIKEHFGVWHSGQGHERPLARISQMFDPLNKTTIDAIISPKHKGERELAARHFLNLHQDDLVLLDRGYPAFWLFLLISSLGSNFCARVSCKAWNITKKFYNSGKREKIITLKPSPYSIKKCKEIGIQIVPIKLRLLRIELKSGQIEMLITSLTDKESLPYELFAELYHLRWPIEEDYKVMKCRMEIENFSGKSVLSIFQDFHAKVFSKNLTSVLAHPTREIIDYNNEHREYDYQLNLTQALSKTKDTIVHLFKNHFDSFDIIENLIFNLHQIFIVSIEPVRPGRSYPRDHKITRRHFHQCYKQTR